MTQPELSTADAGALPRELCSFDKSHAVKQFGAVCLDMPLEESKFKCIRNNLQRREKCSITNFRRGEGADLIFLSYTSEPHILNLLAAAGISKECKLLHPLSQNLSWSWKTS